MPGQMQKAWNEAGRDLEAEISARFRTSCSFVLAKKTIVDMGGTVSKAVKALGAEENQNRCGES